MSDILLNAAETGAGTPVCLLHGLFGRKQNFGVLARHLASSHRVISLDLRNHGASPHVAGMAYTDMASDVLHTLGALDALPCGIVGHSMGGKVAMAAALMRPESVSRLVVADIAPVSYRHHNAGVAAALQALDLSPELDRRSADLALAGAVPDKAVRAFLLQNLVFGAAPAWRIGLSEIAAGMSEIEGWPAALSARRYAGPALFIAGGLSDYVGAEGLQAIGAIFSRARVVTLAEAGHWVHADQAARFGELVAAFLTD